MKQRLRKLLSGFLCFALIASAVVGALSASVLSASADEPSSTSIGTTDIKDELIENYPGYYDAINNFFTQYIDLLWDTSGYWCCALNEGDTWLISLYYNNQNGNDWYSYSFTQYNSTRSGLSRQENAGSNAYNGVTVSQYLYARDGTVSTGVVTGNQSLQFTSAHNLGGNLLNGWLCACPTTYNFNVSGRKCYISVPVALGNGGWSMDANLVHGNAINIIDFHWFKFQLGQRWYVTTYDQSLVANMETGDDTFWAWSFDKYLYSQEDPVTEILTWRDMQYLPAAAQFIEQSVTNVSSNGILAYDITDLVLSGDVIQLALSSFWQVIDSPSGMVLGNVMASSEDIISLVLTAEEENESQNNAWTEINSYIVNYPTASIVPETLADQLSGHNAVGSGMGAVRAPNQIQQWMNQVYFDTDFFQYDLSIGGLDASYESIINFDILDTIIVPAQNLLSETSLEYWDHTYQLVNGTIDTYKIGNISYDNPLFEEYDLILITKSDAQFMGDVSQPYNLAFNGTQAYVGDIQRTDVAHDLYYEPVYWILTKHAIQKSQLYVFCDSQSKLYKLLCDYVEKRDLWDNSFLSWSMSVFWELETVNGHLNSIEIEIKSWDLANKLSSIVTRLQEIADNTSETDVDPWYLALFNWIKAFEPSNFDFIGWVEEYDDFVDELPDPGGATIIPFPTAAPTALPTVAVAGG